MSLISCPECKTQISDKAVSCPNCGNPIQPGAGRFIYRRGFEWKSQTEIAGWPLIHIAIGFNKKTGRLMAAKGIIAIGQFAIGIITIAQFGLGVLFGFGQFVTGLLAIGQFAVGVTAIGQFAFGTYVLAQLGLGKYIWSTTIKDPHAIEYFRNIWESIRNFF